MVVMDGLVARFLEPVQLVERHGELELGDPGDIDVGPKRGLLGKPFGLGFLQFAFTLPDDARERYLEGGCGVDDRASVEAAAGGGPSVAAEDFFEWGFLSISNRDQ